MSVKTVQTDKAPAAIGPYSQGIVANGFLFTAGQIAIDPATGQVIAGNVAAQTERVMSNLAAVLATVNATWKDVVKTTVYPARHERFSRCERGLRQARSATRARPGRPCRCRRCRAACWSRSTLSSRCPNRVPLRVIPSAARDLLFRLS